MLLQTLHKPENSHNYSLFVDLLLGIQFY